MIVIFLLISLKDKLKAQLRFSRVHNNYSGICLWWLSLILCLDFQTVPPPPFPIIQYQYVKCPEFRADDASDISDYIFLKSSAG